MEIQVLVERAGANGYRAVTGPPFLLVVEGATRQEVLMKVQAAVEEKFRTGAEVLRLEVPASEGELIRWNQLKDNPWLRMAGVWKDDPLFEEWQQAIAEYRDQVERDPNYR